LKIEKKSMGFDFVGVKGWREVGSPKSEDAKLITTKWWNLE
jgi:hypothetical protein